jgi:molybdenum cofactor biosynthesis enzyme MoaA
MSQAIFEQAECDYVDLGGGFLSLTRLVADLFLDRDLLDRLRYLEPVPEVTALGVTTNGAMAHRFNDAELGYIFSRFSFLSISIYSVDEAEYQAMTRKKAYARKIEEFDAFCHLRRSRSR